MREITLYIESPDGRQQTVRLENEITIGRTSLAQVVIDDAQLSRVHAVVWREGDEAWIADENSTNGTFVNGGRISVEKKLNDRDEILLGTETRILVEIAESSKASAKSPTASAESGSASYAQPPSGAGKSQAPTPKSQIPMVPLVAGLSAFAIIFVTIVALLLANFLGDGGAGNNTSPPPTTNIRPGAVIPVRVIDPLGGEDPEDLDDLIALFEVEEKELKVEDIGEVNSVSSDDGTKPSELNVPIALWQKQKDLAYAPRSGPVGIAPAGMNVPPQLRGDGVIKQKAKLAEMMRGIPPAPPYQQPMDFADLAQKRLNKELIELPMASDSFFLDVGGSASDGEFTAFSFQSGSSPLSPQKASVLSQLASNFDGQKYDLSNPRDRKQMRIRLLRMFHPRARPILKELADAYFQKFKRPLRVTSLTRSMDYQISLNRTNANSFMVRGPGSLPPHTSGCAFDLARKHMTAEEQNFVMAKLAEMEDRGVLDALIEYNVNACFHVFIYPDGRPTGR